MGWLRVGFGLVLVGWVCVGGCRRGWCGCALRFRKVSGWFRVGLGLVQVLLGGCFRVGLGLGLWLGLEWFRVVYNKFSAGLVAERGFA